MTHVRNLPVPAGPAAPRNWRWLWYIAPPAAATRTYRAIPPRVRSRWALGTSTSHLALRAILAGGGWRAFVFYALPSRAPSLGWKEDYGRGVDGYPANPPPSLSWRAGD